MTDALRLAVEVVALGFFAVVTASYAATTALAVPALLRLRRWSGLFDVGGAASAASAPPVTLVAPMFNEETVCVEAVRALLGVAYPSKEVLVVNDGSTDGTVGRLVEAFDLAPADRPPTAALATADVRGAYRSRTRPGLWLIDKANGGRADAVNAGVNHCRTPLVCVLDGDSLLAPDALHRAARPFLEDATTVAVGGTIGVVNGCAVRHGRVAEVRLPRTWPARFQVLEYVRSFAATRVGWNAVGALPLISGAFGLFRREAVVAVGGLDRDSVGEDFELTLKLHRYHLERGLPYRVDFAPDAVSWTEVPSTLAVLGRQRDRWQRGGLDVVWTHRRMLFNPRYGRVGMFSLPAFLVAELVGPVVEGLSYVALAVGLAAGWVHVPTALVLLALALALGVAQSAAALALEAFAFRRYRSLGALVALLGLGLVENVGYRQLTVWWRLRGVWKFLRGDSSWGTMTRTGFSTAAALVVAATPAVGQPAPGWGGAAGHQVEAFEADREPWQESRVAVQRRFARGAAAFEAGRVRRNGASDPFAGADLYREVGRGYGNVRVRVAPGAGQTPWLDVLGEGYAPLGGGWEGSLGVRHVAFDGGAVTMGTGSAAYYLGDWLVRARGVVVPGEATAVSATLSARYLVRGVGGLTAPFVEGIVGQGREAVPGPGGAPSVRRSWVVGVRGQRPVAGPVGLALGATYTADGALSRWGADVGVVARF